MALVLIFTATVQAAEKPPVTSAERVQNRIGLIGGRMVADMAEYGYFETALNGALDRSGHHLPKPGLAGRRRLWHGTLGVRVRRHESISLETARQRGSGLWL